MSYGFKTLLMLCVVSFAAISNAQVVQIQTPDAFIMAVRPLDMWTPDENYSNRTLEELKEKRVSFSYFEPQGKRFGVYNRVFQGPESAPIADAVISKLAFSGYKIGGSTSSSRVGILQPNAINPTEFSEFIAAQNEIFAKSVIASGNPQNLKTKEGVKRFLNGVVTFATFMAVGEKVGYANANSAVVGNGVAFDIGNSVQKFGHLAIPRPLPNADISAYHQAEIRHASSSNAVGFILIAYKKAKTPDSERAAMVEAIYSLTGADTTAESVNKARMDDLASRQEIWNACVSKGECHE
jgi:hypothetical protein